MMIDAIIERVFILFLYLIQKVIDNQADEIFEHKKLVPAFVAINQKVNLGKSNKKGVKNRIIRKHI